MKLSLSKKKPAPGSRPSKLPDRPSSGDRLSTLRDGLAPSVGLFVLLAIVAADGVVGYMQQDADSLATPIFEDIGITLVGLWILWYLGAVAWFTDRLPQWSFIDRIPEPLNIRDDPKAGETQLTSYRRQATVQIHELIEKMIYDYGLMLTGRTPDLGYMLAHVRTTLQQTVAPVLSSGDRIRPDFGNHVEVTVEWNDGDMTRPVIATAYFIDQSTKIAANGLGVQMPRRKMCIKAAFNHQFTQIIDATLTQA